ncbi:RNA polymerase sigma-70 factor [Mucilaginibacter puniceus]
MAGHKNLSDDELLKLLKASDHAAFNEIYHRYFRLLYIHAYKKIDDEDLAKDVVQDIFTSLWSKRELDFQINNLPAYFIGAVRNKIFDLHAHQKVKQDHLASLQAFLEAKPVISTDHHIREVQLQAYIDQQIRQLPSKMRVIFEMNRKEDLSYKEIAERLETSENNVSKQVNNALRILRTKMGLLFFMLF